MSNYNILSCLILIAFLTTLVCNGYAQPGERQIVSFEKKEGYFSLWSPEHKASLFVDPDDHRGVIKALEDFRDDVQRVTGSVPQLYQSTLPRGNSVVIAGSIEKSGLIASLASSGLLDLSSLENTWEKFVIQVIEAPFEGVDRALVIAGSDKRGTIYGIYELSKQIGVSPWYWWADVPVVSQSQIWVAPDPYTLGEPAVQYRGIFLNNENPSLLGWVNHTFEGFNHKFYGHVYELLLRLRGNYLWPAMWGKALHDDDPMNATLADELGVVISYTHHEPMGRAHVEWDRYGEGPWNYETNSDVLRKFWTEGITRMKSYESGVILGMRGDGDEPMTDEANIDLLERIIADQRQIIDSHAQDKSRLLQTWALYKEVQEYYEKGLRVPDDVMILLANDNWGNIRLLPVPEERDREGGWGMYYHFDYVGGPRNYKWINTIQISRIWEQMNLVYNHGVDRLWLVNVGDLKPMEFPISFFLDYAWNPSWISIDDMNRYPVDWAAQQFGPGFADEIGYLLTEYTRINSRRKPELLNAETYSLHNFREFETVVNDYNALTEKARKIYDAIPEEYRDAYFQLVMYPVEASANINELYYATALNHHYARQLRVATNSMAEKVNFHFDKNQAMDHIYHHEISDGKWVHMMDQTRIGYTYWQQPEENSIPEVVTIQIPDSADMGVEIEGSSEWWNSGTTKDLPTTDRYHRQSFYFEVFNRGSRPFDVTITPGQPWVKTSVSQTTVTDQIRVFVEIDWENAPIGTHKVPISIRSGRRSTVTVHQPIHNFSVNLPIGFSGFIESNGYVAIEASDFTRKIDSNEAGWVKIPQLGRTSSSMTPLPPLAESADPITNRSAPRLEYDVYFSTPGEANLKVFLSPTKNFSKNYRNPDGIRFAVSINDEPPQIVNMHYQMDGGFVQTIWYQWVANNIITTNTPIRIPSVGTHTLKIWMVDASPVIQRIVVETSSIGETYLGPPSLKINSR